MLLERYPLVREEHLRDMQKWGLIRPARGNDGEDLYAFPDVAVVRQAHEALTDGATFRAVLRQLRALHAGQLTFDFRIERRAAKVLRLTPKEPPPLVAFLDPPPAPVASSAEDAFVYAARLDTGDPATFDQAAAGYRGALALDPYLVPALINLANIHYARDEIAEAQALYERAVALEPDVFEAHFNLGNIFHDLGRYQEAQSCYRESLKLNATYADAHLYLAVTLEKSGQPAEARMHWRAYQRLAPQGEWAELAKEFLD
jgi:tetratricopeptide (TPR) repeat protein